MISINTNSFRYHFNKYFKTCNSLCVSWSAAPRTRLSPVSSHLAAGLRAPLRGETCPSLAPLCLPSDPPGRSHALPPNATCSHIITLPYRQHTHSSLLLDTSFPRVRNSYELNVYVPLLCLSPPHQFICWSPKLQRDVMVMGDGAFGR